MRKTFFSIVLLLSALSLGCSSRYTAPIKEYLKDSGIFGQHRLIRIDRFVGISGNLSGLFFMGTGSMNGSIDTNYKLQFWWKPTSEKIVATSLPYEKFAFFVDNEIGNVPISEFVFDPAWLDQEYWYEVGVMPVRTHEEAEKDIQYLVNTIKANQNLSMEHILVVNVRISQATLEKEVFLPKNIQSQ